MASRSGGIRAQAPAQHLGSRIRERRSGLGLKQAGLARAVGISASYLNLIEHDKRPIGGKLLVDLARALDLEPSALSEPGEGALSEPLRTAAAAAAEAGIRAEVDRIEALAARFPGWAATLADQQRRLSALEALVAGLRDRLRHDPGLAETLHEVLSGIAAIRATAGILVEDGELDPTWTARFHRNLNEEALRLSDRAKALLSHFEAPDIRTPAGQEAPDLAPEETVEAFFDSHAHYFAPIEQRGELAIPEILAAAPDLATGPAREMARVALSARAADAARLPMAKFAPAAARAGYSPEALYGLGQGDVALVLRRMAGLPPGAPEFGLAIVDASGGLVFRRRLPGFSVPRLAPGCPLWPIYRAFARPLSPEQSVIEMPDGHRFAVWAVSQPAGLPGALGQPQMHGTMLIAPVRDGASTAPAAPAPDPVGPGCARCPRASCRARRGPMPEALDAL